MQYAPTEFVTSASEFTSLGLGLYATITCVDTYDLEGMAKFIMPRVH